MQKIVTLTILVGSVLLCCPAALAAPPELVSPAGVVEQRCPTFSWSAVPGAAGYELVVYRVAGEEEADPLVSVRLPGGAAAWTPGTDCLSGGRYAWTLRALGLGESPEGTESWAEPAIFEVAATPSLGEVREALSTLRRYLGAERTGGAGPAESVDDARSVSRRASPEAPQRSPRAATRRQASADQQTGTVQPAAAPTLGSPSLTVDSNIALGASSNFFKDGAVFLWDDTTGNTALGRQALASATGTAIRNTAVGRETLRYTVEGSTAVHGSANTAIGDFALRANTTGYRNTATGFEALLTNTVGYFNTATGAGSLRSNTDGTSNTAMGVDALYANTTGRRNTATGFEALSSNTTGFTNTATGSGALSSNTIGYRNTAFGANALQANTEGDGNVAVGHNAGSNATTGDHNIFILHDGVAGDSGKIRIGTEGTQNATFVSGIRGTTTGNADAVTVVIDSAGQLGTVSSSRSLKEDIRDIGPMSQRLLELRPVAFRYREHVASHREGDPETPLQFGLVAEEVAEVFPELVVRDEEGRPQTVKYRLLSTLLLEELQRADRELTAQGEVLYALQDRLGRLEEGRPSVAPLEWRATCAPR